ncbi:hypothetical protein TNCV_4274951 [Trichonephila clavipes]|nr:hypothetical protein TNCV_4274951 [Trichonephila clavipes]
MSPHQFGSKFINSDEEVRPFQGQELRKLHATRLTRQLVSSHQQFNVHVDGLMRSIKLCIVQSTRCSAQQLFRVRRKVMGKPKSGIFGELQLCGLGFHEVPNFAICLRHLRALLLSCELLWLRIQNGSAETKLEILNRFPKEESGASLTQFYNVGMHGISCG